MGAIAGILVVLVALYDKDWIREDLGDLLIAAFQFEPSARPVLPYIIAIFLYILAIIVTFAVKSTKAIGIVLIVISVITMILVREINALAASASLLIAGILASRHGRRKQQTRKARNALIRFWQRLNKQHNIKKKAEKAHEIQEWNDISHELYEILEKYEGDLPHDIVNNLRAFTYAPDTRLDKIIPEEIVEKYEDLMSEIQHAIDITKTAEQVAAPVGTGVGGVGGVGGTSASAPLSTAAVAAVATVATAGIGGIAYGSVTGYVPILHDRDLIVTSSADPEDIYRYLADDPQQGLVEVSRERCFGSIDEVGQTFLSSQVQGPESAQNSSTTTTTIQLSVTETGFDNIFQTAATNTEPENVDVIEVTPNYIEIDENSFSIGPSSVERSQQGQTIIKWENVGQYVGNRDNKLSANETFDVSFSAGVLSNMGNGSQRLPVSVKEESVVKYTDSSGNIQGVMIPQTYVNIDTQICQDGKVEAEEFRLVYDTFIVPGSNDGTLGVYEERGSNVFKPYEEINLYAEYAGTTQEPVDDGFGNTKYRTNTTGNFIITDKEGNIMSATVRDFRPFDTHTFDTRLVNHSSFYIFKDYMINGSRHSGDYVIHYTITDSLSGEKIERDIDFIIEGEEEPTELLTAEIISNGTEGVAPAAFEFEANLTGGTEPYSYLWDFGDGSEESDEQTVLHTFEEFGTYNVTLAVTDTDNQTAYDSIEITVEEPAAPPPTITDPLTAGIDSNGTQGVAPAAFEFEADVAGGTGPYTYSWDFDDGSEESDEQTVLHTFEEFGTYNVTLAVTDREDETAYDSIEITVEAAPLPPVPTITDPLTAEIISDGTEGVAPAAFEFEADVAGGTGPYTYSWDFDDGEESDEQTVLHTFEEARSYDVGLTVRDSNGRTASDSIVITVEEQPPPLPPIEEPAVATEEEEEEEEEEPPTEEPAANETEG